MALIYKNSKNSVTKNISFNVWRDYKIVVSWKGKNAVQVFFMKIKFFVTIILEKN